MILAKLAPITRSHIYFDGALATRSMIPIESFFICYFLLMPLIITLNICSTYTERVRPKCQISSGIRLTAVIPPSNALLISHSLPAVRQSCNRIQGYLPQFSFACQGSGPAPPPREASVHSMIHERFEEDSSNVCPSWSENNLAVYGLPMLQCSQPR